MINLDANYKSQRNSKTDKLRVTVRRKWWRKDGILNHSQLIQKKAKKIIQGNKEQWRQTENIQQP